ncbi:hypothetical protein K431DRAFT_233580 [Polychaeton citri CBS 116435]|uniref:Phosphatidate phosphatase APP1 catalytic domain-containing protein n=1 Tax=Polychaeton citri CBS 116435 TaxID=1314669 RepID=A0A9P4UKA5_9PEZI|nr:hypothetical protein K431DRAFT_233580 [Polychaeton citri CBS 116435]
MNFLRGLAEQGRRATVDLLHGEEIERDSPFSPEVPDELREWLPDLFDRFPVVLPWEKSQPVDPALHEVWLYDNTAFRSPAAGEHRPGLRKPASRHDTKPTLIDSDGKSEDTPSEGNGWEVEFVSSYFIKNSGKDLSRIVAAVAKALNVNDDDEATKKRIALRVQPFVDFVLPNRTVRIAIDKKEEQTLGPSNYSGNSLDLLTLHFDSPSAPSQFDSWAVATPPPFGHSATTVVAEEHGWGIISDIDDTIKVTQTPSPLGILETTFLTEEPQPVKGMPELYTQIATALSTPAFFYLSASPYNLYPFLKKFRSAHYPQGTILLRDASWQNLGGLVTSLTHGTQEYKADRIRRVHGWFPHRRFICIGDSTQTDPEAYGESARRFPGWIKAVFIRKVTDIAAMDTDRKNSDERFEAAFKGLDPGLWQTFTDPSEIAARIEELSREGDGEAGAS